MQHENRAGDFYAKIMLCRGQKNKSLLKQKVADVENMFLVFNAACYSNYLPTMMLIECDLDRDKKCWGRKIKTMAGGWYRIKLQTYLQLLSLRLAEGSSETSAADQWMEGNLMEGHEIFPAKQKHQKNPPPTKTHANDNISTSLGAPKCEASGRMFIRKIYGLCDNVELRKQEWGMRWQALFIVEANER